MRIREGKRNERECALLGQMLRFAQHDKVLWEVLRFDSAFAGEELLEDRVEVP